MKRAAASVWAGMGLVTLAFGVRLGHLLAVHEKALFDVPIGDGRAYDDWAR